MSQGLPPSTHRTYKSAQLRFLNFCTQSGRLHPNGSPCPAREWTLCLFATHLSGSLSSASIKIYLSAVRSLYIDLGFPDPLVNCLQLQPVLRGIRRTRGSPGPSRLPITDLHMLIIHNSLSFAIQDHVMFWAASPLAYFGFLRSAEFTVPSLSAFNPDIHLTVDDNAVDSHTSPSCLQLTIKASKTDPFRKGCCLYIGLGRPPLCALSAIMNYQPLRGQSPGPLFLLSSGQPLSRTLLTHWLKDIFAAAGIQGSFSSHSFRIGAATVAARMGVPDHLIQAVGRWNSDAYKLYIRTPAEALAQVTSLLSH